MELKSGDQAKQLLDSVDNIIFDCDGKHLLYCKDRADLGNI